MTAPDPQQPPGGFGHLRRVLPVQPRESEGAVPPAPLPAPESVQSPLPGRATQLLPLALVRYNPLNPRQQIDPDKLAELAEGIATNGLMQPIEVRPLDDGTYETIYGNTRLRAFKELLAPCDQARWGRIEAFVTEASNLDAFIRSWEENDKRADLSQADELGAVAQALSIGLNVTHHLTQLQRIFRRSESWVRRRARLCALPTLRERIAAGRCTIDEAFEALSATNSDPDAAGRLLDRAYGLGLSRRDFRALLHEEAHPAAGAENAAPGEAVSAVVITANLTPSTSAAPPLPAVTTPVVPPSQSIEPARARGQELTGQEATNRRYRSIDEPHEEPTGETSTAARVPPGAPATTIAPPHIAPTPTTFTSLAEDVAEGLAELAALAIAQRERRLTIRTLSTAQLLASGRLVAAHDLLAAFHDDLLAVSQADRTDTE